MQTLAGFSLGRVLLHLLAAAGDREFRFHAAGIAREWDRFLCHWRVGAGRA